MKHLLRLLLLAITCLLASLSFSAGKDPEGRKPSAAAALKTTSGIFTGIEEGDYAHWNMKTGKGDEVSYFILTPDPSIEKVLENPKPFIGRKCVVKWKASKENIPEAGGKIDVEQVISVEWK